LEGRLQDVSVSADVCESDSVFVNIELLKASSFLEQAVIERLAAGMNGRDVATVTHLSVGLLRAPLLAQPLGAAGVPAQQATSLDSWSPGRGGGAGSPEPGFDAGGELSFAPLLGGMRGGAAAAAAGAPQAQRHHGSWASMESVRVYEGGGLQGAGFIDDALPSASLGSRRPSAARDPASRRRQEARQAAARERCHVPAAAVYLAPPAQGAGAQPPPPSAADVASDPAAAAPSTPEAAAAAAAGGILSLDVFAESAAFRVPHDQSVGRLIIVAETWSKAVKQVARAHAAALQSAVAALKPRRGAQKPQLALLKPKRPKPAYVELIADVGQVVFAMEQHPLERWMALHGPALAAAAAQRHLAEQLVSSVALSKRNSRSGGDAGGGGAGVARGAAEETAAGPGGAAGEGEVGAGEASHEDDDSVDDDSSDDDEVGF
jgi:hypothetical protein